MTSLLWITCPYIRCPRCQHGWVSFEIFAGSLSLLVYLVDICTLEVQSVSECWDRFFIRSFSERWKTFTGELILISCSTAAACMAATSLIIYQTGNITPRGDQRIYNEGTLHPIKTYLTTWGRFWLLLDDAREDGHLCCGISFKKGPLVPDYHQCTTTHFFYINILNYSPLYYTAFSLDYIIKKS